jgi:hypothetical protein
MSEAAVAEAVPKAEAPPAAAPAPAPPAPFTERDLARQGTVGVQLAAPEPAYVGGLWLRFWLPPVEDNSVGQADAAACRALRAALAAARQAALAGPEHQELVRRLEAARSATSQVAYFEIRQKELRSQIRGSLAANESPEQAEVNLAHAEGEGKRFATRAAQLRPLIEESRQQSEAALRRAVAAAYSAAHAAARDEWQKSQAALLAALNPLALRYLQAKAALEAVHGLQVAREQESELPPAEEKRA